MKQEVTNFARFYAIMKRIAFGFGGKEDNEDYKRELVAQYTEGRTESLKEVTRREYEAMCEGMERVCGVEQEAWRRELRRHRSTVLHLMQKAGIDTTDWARVDAFCMDKRIAGKKFRMLDGEELDAVAVKLRVIRRKDTARPIPRRGAHDGMSAIRMVGLIGMAGGEVN